MDRHWQVVTTLVLILINVFRLDYMYKRRVFTMDPDYFPHARMREIIDYLHEHDQRYGKSYIHH